MALGDCDERLSDWIRLYKKLGPDTHDNDLEAGTCDCLIHKDGDLMRLICLICATSLTACAMQYPVLKMGQDTYQASAVASPARGGIAGAQRMALSNANKQCDSLGKAITVTNIESGQDFPVAGRAIVTFTCT